MHKTQVRAVSPQAVVPIIASGQWESSDSRLLEERAQIYAAPDEEDYLFDTGFVGLGLGNSGFDDDITEVWRKPKIDVRAEPEP